MSGTQIQLLEKKGLAVVSRREPPFVEVGRSWSELLWPISAKRCIELLRFSGVVVGEDAQEILYALVRESIRFDPSRYGVTELLTTSVSIRPAMVGAFQMTVTHRLEVLPPELVLAFLGLCAGHFFDKEAPVLFMHRPLVIEGRGGQPRFLYAQCSPKKNGSPCLMLSTAHEGYMFNKPLRLIYWRPDISVIPYRSRRT